MNLVLNPELPSLLSVFISKVGNEFAVAVVALALCPILVNYLKLQTLILNPKLRSLLAVFTSKVGNEFAVAVVALALYPLLIEATKNTQGHDKVKV